MANFFLDNKDLKYHLSHPLMRKIVELKERNFTEKDLYDYAPQNFEDAMDSYMRVMEIIGGVCAVRWLEPAFSRRWCAIHCALHLSSISLTSTFRARPSDPKTWTNVCAVDAYRFWTMPLSMP